MAKGYEKLKYEDYLQLTLIIPVEHLDKYPTARLEEIYKLKPDKIFILVGGKKIPYQEFKKLGG